MINRSSLYTFFFFLAFFSINGLFINPVYVLGFFGVILSLFFIKTISVTKITVVNFIFFLVISFGFIAGFYFQDFYYKEITPVYLSSILFCYSILLGLFCYEIGLKIAIDKRKMVYKIVNKLLLLFLIVELILRVLNPDYSEISFYKYKSSVLYYDSNFTGIVVSVFLMFFVFLSKKGIYDIGKISFILYLILLILTFSRASIVAFIISYICVVTFGKYFRYLVVLILAGFTYFAFKLVNLYLSGESFIDFDGSFNSKFYIISQAIELYGSLPFMLKFFGIGLANFAQYAGIFAHNIIVTFVFEFGIFGSFAFIFYFVYMYLKTKGNVLYILLPVLIGGFSLFSAYSAFLFILSIAVLIETKSTEKGI